MKLDPFNAFVYRGSLRASNPLNYILKDWKIGVKDNMAISGWPMTCGSRSLKEYVSPYTADVVESLMDLGAEIVGKANMDEFGMGSRGERSVFGSTLNPLDEGKSPGGSSSGCSAAISGGLCRLAIGSDTGGSVRLPASYTGTVGYKPTWGVLSRYGLVSYAPSLDTVGLMGRSVGDIVTSFEGLMQMKTVKKWKDPTVISLKGNELDSNEPLPLEGITIGVVEEWLEALRGITSHPLDSILNALENKSGARLKLVSIPELVGGRGSGECLEMYYKIASMEASSTLSRYTGNFFERFQHQNNPSTGLEIDSSKYPESVENYQLEFLGPEVRKRIQSGRDLLGSLDGNDNLIKSEGYRMGLRRSFDRVFREECCDVLIGPTAFSSAPMLRAKSESESEAKVEEEREDDFFTVPANLAGIPAISVPLHAISSGTDGVIGTQLMAAHGDDRLLLRVSRELESFFK